MDFQPENILVKWSVPECPFTVEYSARALDDVRLAVTDAFFSLPRGGAEIGGLLLGRHEPDRVLILDSLPLDCEHAFGPSFVLSERDHAKLADLLAEASKNPLLKPVGWWHSHTRSEIFLSDADQQIHNSFFPEPWQVAAVLKPHTFQPTRLGFFFREADGSIHAAGSYREDALQPLPMKPAGAPIPPPVEAPALRPEDRAGRVIDVSAAANGSEPPVEAPDPAPVREEVAPPAFVRADEEPPREPRRWTGWVAAAAGVALAIAGYSTRDRWLPTIQAALAGKPAEAVSLNTVDREGELQVRWNGAAPAVRSATAGSLLILDGSATVTVPLDAPHAQSGAFTYRRKSDRVDVTLALTQPGGKEVRVATLFAGGPPPRTAASETPPATAPPDDSVLRQELQAAQAESAAAKLDLARQIERNKLLEKGLEEMRKVLQRERQRKRLEAQAPDAGK